ncbi:hypothetical protein T484DRAFT_1747932 [Baffinella frigidus]|nr:hypothetical protein T484DRAFT_1747932 [Cryptophyta sp. CCMP2293]
MRAFSLVRAASLALLVSLTSAFSTPALPALGSRARVCRGAPNVALLRPSYCYSAPAGAGISCRSSRIESAGDFAVGADSGVEIMDPAGEETLAFRVWSDGRGQVPAGDVVIKEGEGWGEGRHPSTYMCLQFVWDEVHPRADPAVPLAD